MTASRSSAWQISPVQLGQPFAAGHSLKVHQARVSAPKRRGGSSERGRVQTSCQGIAKIQ